jgi:hypothetical protein
MSAFFLKPSVSTWGALMRKHACLLFFFSLLPISIFARGGDAPAGVAAALVLKTVGFETHIGASRNLTVYVMGAQDVAVELQKGVGKAVGTATLQKVSGGTKPPNEKPSVLFIGRGIRADEAVAYAQTHQVLTVTNDTELLKQGVAMGFALSSDGKPEIWLNMPASARCGLDWNQAIIKVAKIIQQ